MQSPIREQVRIGDRTLHMPDPISPGSSYQLGAMPIGIHIIRKQHVAVFIMEGFITAKDIAEAIVGVSGAEGWQASFRHLWLARPGCELEVTADGVRFFEAATAGLNHLARGDRTAIVVEQGKESGYMRLLGRDRMRFSRDMRLFTELPEALEWLDVHVDVLSKIAD